MSRTLKVTGNHVMYDHGTWLLMVSHVKFACFVLLAVSEETKTQLPDFQVFSFKCIIKQLLDLVFVISRIIKVSVRVINLSLGLQLITPAETLITLAITKMSSNKRPSPSSLVRLFQNKSKCEIFHMKMSSASRFIFMQIKVIFIRMVSHLDLLWNRGTGELGNGLLGIKLFMWIVLPLLYTIELINLYHDIKKVAVPANSRGLWQLYEGT